MGNDGNGPSNGSATRLAPHRLGFGVLMTALASLGCRGHDVTAGTGTDDRISMTPQSVSVPVGHSVQMTVIITDYEGRVLPRQPVTFAVRDPAIATVTIDQSIVGLSPGKTIVSAMTKQGHVADSQVTVTPKP